jgi:RNA polymerase sigma-70 factor (ECF subfamily)
MIATYASMSGIVKGRPARDARPADGRSFPAMEAFPRLASQELTTLERIGQGDQRAVQDCIDRFGNLVWSLARRLSGNQADAEDAVQEIFVDIWRSAARYDPSIASETTFIAMIARRRLIDRRRRLGRRPTEVSAPAASEMYEDQREAGPDMLELGDDAAKARSAFGALSPEQQRVLQLSLQFGLSHQRISEATGLPLGTVKTHARRGLLRIREALGGENGDSFFTDDEHKEAAR